MPSIRLIRAHRPSGAAGAGGAKAAAGASGAELLAYIRTEQALWKPVIEQISTFKAAPK